MVSVLISILNYNSENETLECLKSLKTLNDQGIRFFTFVLDNGSLKRLQVKLSEFKNINLLVNYSLENLGFSGGHNKNIRKVVHHKKIDYFLIMNNDVIVDPQMLKELVTQAENDPTIGIAVPKIYFAKGYEFHKERYKESTLGKVIWYAGGLMDWKNIVGHHRGVDQVDEGHFDISAETEYATGACMLVRTDIVRKLGLFDDKYFLYYEDTDLSMKVKKAGYKIVYVPTSVLWHKNAVSAKGAGSEMQDYYITRNRMLFGMKYAPLRTKLALIRESFHLLFKGRPWQKAGIRDFYTLRFGKGSYK